MYEHNFPAMQQRESELEPTKLRHSPSEMMLPRRLVKEFDLPRQAGSIMLHKKVRSWYRGSKTPVTRKGEQRAASPPHHSIQPSPILLSSSLSLLDVAVKDSSPYSRPVSERIPRRRCHHHRRSQEPHPPTEESSRTSSIRSLRRHYSQPLPSSPRTSVTAHSLPPQESDGEKQCKLLAACNNYIVWMNVTSVSRFDFDVGFTCISMLCTLLFPFFQQKFLAP